MGLNFSSLEPYQDFNFEPTEPENNVDEHFKLDVSRRFLVTLFLQILATEACLSSLVDLEPAGPDKCFEPHNTFDNSVTMLIIVFMVSY